MSTITSNTRRFAPHSGNSRSLLGELFWIGYLLGLLLMSFLSGPYHSSAWLFFSSGFYLFFAAYLIAACFGMGCNWRALVKAKPLIICLILSLLWLFLQTVLPGNDPLPVAAQFSLVTPEWFSPDLRMSIVPEKTRWLMLTNLFVLGWFLMTLLVLDSRRRIRQLLMILILIGVFHAGAAIMAMYADVYFVDRSQLDGHFRLARGWFVNRNHFAAYLNLTLVGALSYLIKKLLTESGGSRLAQLLDQLLSPFLLYFAATLLILVALMMSQSRGGVASIVAASLIMYLGMGIAGARIRVDWRWLLPLSLLFLLLLVNYGSELLTRFTNEALSLGERKAQWE
ncbi:MAG: hypothetical protein HKN85_06420, partial [Gammaproteobacteria bacterium]|nr:hypothetical protein [Gammaproteobacteria bacterium]